MKATVEQVQKWGCTATCPSQGILILDDPPIEKFGKKMEGAHHAKLHHVWGYPLVNVT